MTKPAPLRTDPAVILDAVEELLESESHDSWQVRDVAEKARVSLATIYKHFPSRELLTQATVERWMDSHVYHFVQPRRAGEQLFDFLLRMFRTIFVPWEQHPLMLDAFVSVQSTGGGERLFAQGQASMEAIGAAFAGLTPSDATAIGDILMNVTYGAMLRYTARDIPITQLLPSIERALEWMKEPSDTFSLLEAEPSVEASHRMSTPRRTL